MKTIIILLLSSILIFWAGYNYTFNTIKTITKNMSRARYSEDSEKYKRSMSESNMFRAKISGVAMMIMAIIFFGAFIVKLIGYFAIN